MEFKQALDLALREKPEMLCMVDETHRDRNASRRRRGYGKQNGGGLKIDTWFKNVVRYTMIGVADINGFIVSACNTYIRDEISDEGVAGTVTREVFEDWVEKFLCPHLGDYSRSQPRSVVLLDNASTHLSQKVIDLIEARGAIIIYTAPFSPDLNPIESYFSVYKKYLKKYSDEMDKNWQKTHLDALHSVDRDTGIKYFRKCGIPGAKNVLTSEENENVNMESAIAIVIILLIQQYLN